MDLTSRPIPNLLLNQALRDKTEAIVRECLATAKARYPTFEFEMPSIRYDVKNTDGGLANGPQWLIRLNLVLCVENEEYFLATTLPHEVAHLVQRRVYGTTKKNKNGKIVKVLSHGPEWREVMALFKVPAKPCHQYDITSIQKRWRSKKHALISAQDLHSMLKRLENGVKRLGPHGKRAFACWLEEHIEAEENA